MEIMVAIKVCHFQMFSLQCPDEVIGLFYNVIAKHLKEGPQTAISHSLSSVEAPR